MATTMKPVKSSSVTSVGYDAATRVLAVHFKHSTKLYHYQDVPQEVVDAMHASPSIGSFIATRVKPHYSHHAVETA